MERQWGLCPAIGHHEFVSHPVTLLNAKVWMFNFVCYSMKASVMTETISIQRQIMTRIEPHIHNLRVNPQAINCNSYIFRRSRGEN